jgi:hypothetical protein
MKESAAKAMENPTKQFDSPFKVLESSTLTADEKLAILKNWENEAHQLQTATEENMYGGEQSRIEDIREAIDQLSKSEGLHEDHKKVPAKP